VFPIATFHHNVRRTKHNKQGGVSHCGLAIYIKKYLQKKKTKEEL
jgi:hypothetical protein